METCNDSGVGGSGGPWHWEVACFMTTLDSMRSLRSVEFDEKGSQIGLRYIKLTLLSLTEARMCI
jgi:hypothetical protein